MWCASGASSVPSVSESMSRVATSVDITLVGVLGLDLDSRLAAMDLFVIEVEMYTATEGVPFQVRFCR